MPRLIDLWRAVDVEARLVSGSVDRLTDPVRWVGRGRALAPRLPEVAPGTLLIVDAGHVGPSLVGFLADLAADDLHPVGLLVGTSRTVGDPVTDQLPILVSTRSVAELAARADAYLADEERFLADEVADVRLAAAEYALAHPDPAAVAGLVAGRLRRGIAVTMDGALIGLIPRPAGRALAARFAAGQARLLAHASGSGTEVQRGLAGLVVSEHRIRAGAAVWVFDDLPLAALDDRVARSLATTLRALLQRVSVVRPLAVASPPVPPIGVIEQTLLAVARSNGRIAPAARTLGVHRNTVLYRLRIAKRDHGLDPRLADDALRILRDRG